MIKKQCLQSKWLNAWTLMFSAGWSPYGSSSKLPLGAIVGGVVGGVAVLLAIFALYRYKPTVFTDPFQRKKIDCKDYFSSPQFDLIYFMISLQQTSTGTDHKSASRPTSLTIWFSFNFCLFLYDLQMVNGRFRVESSDIHSKNFQRRPRIGVNHMK